MAGRRIALIVLILLPLPVAVFYLSGYIVQALGPSYDTLKVRQLEPTSDAKAVPKPLPPKAFRRERLVYSISSWLGNSGTVTLEIGPLITDDSGRRFYQMNIELETNKTTSAIYVMKGTAAVAFDAVTLLPLVYEQNIRSGMGITGGKIRRRKLLFDQEKHTLDYWKAKGKDGELKHRRQRKIPEGAHHFLTIIPMFQHTPLKAGQKLEFTTTDRKRDMRITGSVLREEPYDDIHGKKRTALVLETTTDLGKEDVEGGSLLIWLDEESHIPVRLDVKIPLGTMTGKLVSRTEIKEPAPKAK
jgi:uncharacterized protein DUF3108